MVFLLLIFRDSALTTCLLVPSTSNKLNLVLQKFHVLFQVDIFVHAIPSALNSLNLQALCLDITLSWKLFRSLNPRLGTSSLCSHESSTCLVMMCVLLYCDCSLTYTCSLFTINVVSAKTVRYLCISVPQLQGIL